MLFFNKKKKNKPVPTMKQDFQSQPVKLLSPLPTAGPKIIYGNDDYELVYRKKQDPYTEKWDDEVVIRNHPINPELETVLKKTGEVADLCYWYFYNTDNIVVEYNDRAKKTIETWKQREDIVKQNLKDDGIDVEGKDWWELYRESTIQSLINGHECAVRQVKKYGFENEMKNLYIYFRTKDRRWNSRDWTSENDLEILGYSLE